MYNVELHKILGGTTVRTATTRGQCKNLPKIGESFEIVAPPLVAGSIARVVTTSTIQQIIPEENGMIIKTLNSTYKVEVKNNADMVFNG